MKIYTLTVIRETMEERANVQTALYSHPEDAIEAYNEAFDDAKYDSQFFALPRDEKEVATDTPYRWWRIYDEGGCYSSITIELDTIEVK